MASEAKFADFQDHKLSDEEKRHLHEWSLDWQIEENERLFGDESKGYPREPVDTQQVLADAGIKAPPLPPPPSPAGQSMYTGPTVVEGENDEPAEVGSIGTRVPLPRNHPFTVEVDEGDQLPNTVVVPESNGGFDEDAQWADVCDLTVAELKDNLKELDQPVGGSKDELRERLFNALREANAAEE